jgi:hypothetical protein
MLYSIIMWYCNIEHVLFVYNIMVDMIPFLKLKRFPLIMANNRWWQEVLFYKGVCLFVVYLSTFQ